MHPSSISAPPSSAASWPAVPSSKSLWLWIASGMSGPRICLTSHAWCLYTAGMHAPQMSSMRRASMPASFRPRDDRLQPLEVEAREVHEVRVHVRALLLAVLDRLAGAVEGLLAGDREATHRLDELVVVVARSRTPGR